MDKMHHIAVSAQKIKSLQKCKTAIIMHSASPRWQSLYNKHCNEGLRIVTFYNQMYDDKIIVKIVHMTRLTISNECVIRMTIEL